MSYNILGINLSHNSSVCVLSDGEIVFFLEEERLSRNKADIQPLYLLNYVSNQFNINEIVISGLSNLFENNYSYKKSLFYSISQLFPNIPFNDLLDKHHLTHASCSFSNSGFKSSLVLVIDGNGSPLTKDYFELWETESIFSFNYKLPPKTLYKSFRSHNLKDNLYDPLVNITKTYEAINVFLGLGTGLECGKTMGLSSYGSYNKNIPPLIINKKGNPTAFKYISPYTGYFNLDIKYKKDLAYHIQKETQEAVGDYIEEYLNKTNHKNVVCSGGYFLNCVANYYLTKRFPDVKFYFEPISSDAGTSIGAAKLIWQKKIQDITLHPQKTLYYGPKYSKEELLEGIKKYL